MCMYVSVCMYVCVCVLLCSTLTSRVALRSVGCSCTLTAVATQFTRAWLALKVHSLTVG